MSTARCSGKTAWGKNRTEEEMDEPIVSLVEIMSEELAEQVEEQESTSFSSSSVFDSSLSEFCLDPKQVGDCSDDFLIAQALQRQFDREYDITVQLEEQKRAGGSKKVSMSCDRYRLTHDDEMEDDASSDESDTDIREKRTHRLYNQQTPDMGPSGFVRAADGSIVTKHDKEVTARRNMAKMMEFPPDFPTGDAIAEKLDNKVFNILKSYSKTEQKRHIKVKDKEEKATSDLSVDAVTRLILFKWINAELIDQVEGVIATGKESVVLHAIGRVVDEDSGESVETHYAVKVYKTVLSEFKNRGEYVRDDFRFKNPRRVLRVWAEKELMNLVRMNNAGLNCPKPIKLKKHVFLMSFIGTDEKAAPKLKDVQWADETSKMTAFEQIRSLMTRLFRECRLVHGDLNEFNVLLDNAGQCHMIDVSQAVDVSHPRALYYLVRDIENVVNFFGRMGCEELPTPCSLFNEITELSMNEDEDLQNQVEIFESVNRCVRLRKEKANPNEPVLRQYLAEATGRDDSPSRLYN